MATTIIPKKSTVSGKVPDAASLSSGEIAINLTDGKLYAKHTDGSIVDLTGALELHTHSISQVSGLQSELNSKLEDAPTTGEQYVRQSGTWTQVDIPEGYTSTNFNSDFATKDTDDLSEGTSNLYHTTSRARSAISASGDLSYSSSTGVISFNETYSTAGEIKTAYESNTNTNAYTDAEKTKLAGIESGAEVNVGTNLGQSRTTSSYTVTSSTGSNTTLASATTTSAGVMSSADKSKLNGIEAGATADQTASEIKTAYESNTDTNAFTDAEQSKLAGIDAGAEVNAVDSVNGKTGVVSLSTSDVSEGTNLYHTNSRVRGAISVSGDLSYSATTGVISFNETYSSATELLTAVKTVDGSSSGLDADLLDGKHASAFATSAQGSLANSAVQPGDLATVATSGSYNDLTNKPDLSVLEEVMVYTSRSTFPSSGESGKVYIAENTGYMYRWNGTGYTQLTDQTAIWGQVSGTLSDQTDLQSALNGKANSSHSHSAGDLPSTIMYEGENISLLNNNSGYITSAQAPVQSVNGSTGSVVLDTNDVSEGTSNLYFTNARARGAISVSGDLSYSSGVISFNETYSSASELLTAIKGVDGSGSGLDADTLDGKHASAFAAASHTHNYDNYGSWTVSDGTASESIGSGATLTVSGSGATSTSYNASTNTLTVSSTNTTYSAGTGISLSGTTFSLSDERYTNAEKTKLANIEAGAEVNDPTNLGQSRNGTSYTITSSTGTNTTLAAATTTVAGVMSASDKTKLNGIESGAEVNTVDSVNGKTGAVNLTASDVGLGTVRNVASYSQTEADGRFVNDTGDSMTGTYTINTVDDGVSDLQVGGDVSFRGNTGLGNDDPTYRVDVSGDARVRDENGMKFGGTGAGDAKYSIQYNSATQSLDFNFLGA